MDTGSDPTPMNKEPKAIRGFKAKKKVSFG